jgi:D-cysteine desulfhydrase
VTAPRYALAVLPTPLHRLPALEAATGGGPLYLKRDDLIGFGLAGNKARALEYLLGAALADRADVLVTAGSPASNFVAAAALAARVGGLSCDILVSGPPRDTTTLALARTCGAQLCFTGADRETLDDLVADHADRLRRQGRRPYPVPRGGATPVGAFGFAAAARELAGQLDHDRFDHDNATVVLPTGSGASLAGFLAGRAAIGARWRVYGVSVSRPATLIRGQILDLATRCAALAGTPPPDPDDLHLVDAVGPGFGQPGDRDRASARLALHRAGILLDGTYGAKALTALADLDAAGPVVFWHGGGYPGALTLLGTP